MKIREIAGMAIDLCGARMVEKLPAHTAVMHVLSVIDDMELALSHSSKGMRLTKTKITLSSKEGSLGASELILPEFIRYRPNNTNPVNSSFGYWRTIDFVTAIDDLTLAEQQSREAIMISGISGDLRYTLSFTPTYAIDAELYGRFKQSDTASIDGIPSIPEQYSRFAAVQAALLMLDEVLLLDNAAQYQPFVQSRTAKLMEQKHELQHWWEVYRSNADDSRTAGNTRNYDPFEVDEFGGFFNIR